MNNPFNQENKPKMESLRKPPPITERMKEELGERKLLSSILESSEVEPKAALELIAAQRKTTPEMDEKLEDLTKALLDTYGLSRKDLSEVEFKQIHFILKAREAARNIQGREDIQNILQNALNKALINRAFLRIDQCAQTLKKTSTSEDTRAALISTMQALEGLSRGLPENSPAWDMILQRYSILLQMKKGSSIETSKVFSDVFDEFNDFIEDEFVDREVKHATSQGESANLAKIMKEVYGRSIEEVEDLKRKNRERATQKIEELKEKPYTSFDDLIELHRTNNRGIVPKETSRMRKDNEVAIFGVRLGTFPQDLPKEIKAFNNRIEILTDKALIENTSDTQYEIAVAKLHNEILDMHPFGDRNGSTALLFIELMQARRGYKPPKEREPNYYKALGKALDFNPVAMAIVGYEQYKISHEPGYFEGETVIEKKKDYDLAISAIKSLREGKIGKKAQPPQNAEQQMI